MPAPYNPLPNSGPRLTFVDLLHDVGEWFRTKRQWSDYPWWCWAILAAIAALVAWRIARRYRAQQAALPHFSPRAMFTELCVAHRLDRPSRELLAELAQVHHPDNPARIFLDPDRFHPDRLLTEFRPRQELVDRLRKKLFSDL